MNKILIIVSIVIVLGAAVFIFRINKDIKKKLNFENTYAIINSKSGKALRVKNAGIDNGKEIVLYSHSNWECMTWELIELTDNSFLLKNLYTQKTFQPLSDPDNNVKLFQQTLGGTGLQCYEFEKQTNGEYMIKLKNTELYITTASNENNTPVFLRFNTTKDDQMWKLVRQNPIF